MKEYWQKFCSAFTYPKSLNFPRHVNASMGKQSSLNGSRLYCSIQTYKDEVFFSLVDYRNSRFTSKNPNKIIEFYDSLKNRDDLIQWMKERPKGVANIYEVDGDKEITVVIPTADFNGKYAKECRENIFKGLHLIYVESGGKEDFYFNIAHNCNVGIRKAMEYDPKWVVISNDDMYKIDEINILLKELSMIDNGKVMSVFTRPSRYHSFNTCVGKKRFLLTDIAYFSYHLKGKRLRHWRTTSKIAKKNNYAVERILGPRNRLLGKWFLSEAYFFPMTGPFGILSSHFCRAKEKVFNETYQNGVEDWELSIELSKFEKAIIDYRIGDVIGATLGNDLRRTIRDLANLVYFNERVQALLQNNEVSEKS